MSNYFASAKIYGSYLYPQIHGTVTFRQRKNGVIVTAHVYGLPIEGEYKSGIFAFHVHNGSCVGGLNDPFSEADGHYNPNNCPHPYHAGDMPPLFANNGYAYMSFFTNRFAVKDIIGKIVIIHKNPDDFTTQPSGNAGEKIACGKIF